MYISNGNRKVNALIWSLPTKKTCIKASCWGYCYASKAERFYPGVLPSRENNLDASTRASFVIEMIELLKSKKKDIVRIHESGDFYSQDYVKKWYEICNALPNKTFYAYTKRHDIFDWYLLLNKPQNLKLIYSMDSVRYGKLEPIIPKGYDKVAYVHDTRTNCPAIKDKSVKCMEHCDKCINDKTKSIVFKKH